MSCREVRKDGLFNMVKCPVPDDSLDTEIIAAAKEYSSRSPWVEHSGKAVEYLTIVNGDLEVLFTNHVQPGVESVIGLCCLVFLPPDQQDKLRSAITQALATGLPWHFETQATGPHGEMSWYSGWATVLSTKSEKTRVALIGTDISHVRRVEEKLALSDETFRSLVTGASDFISVVDREHRISFLNRVNSVASVEEVYGIPVEEFVPKADRERVHAAVERVFETGSFESYEIKVQTSLRDPAIVQSLNTRLSPVYQGVQVVGVTMISTDVTQINRDREALRASEEKLRQSQQLQSIGQLTGGIAHDFNNLLMVMQGSLQLARHTLDDRKATLELIDDAFAASERAADLTQHLLAFGRRQSLQPVSIAAGDLLASLASMMRRTLGAQVEILTESPASVWDCFADRVQLESALLNLGINARDALGPSGGTLVLRASNFIASPGNRELAPDLEPGNYLRLEVEDNGPGIDEETVSRVFEPFFTTKGVGRGSGLGLSMVYGFVQQSGGHVSLSSVVGKGTTITLYLPKGLGMVEELEVTKVAHESHGANAHIFVVEDVPEVARLTRRILDLYGYKVSLAENGADALEMLPELHDVKVLLTDIGLPGYLNGVALAQEVRKLRPDIRVIFMTGYDNGLLDGEPGAKVLRKPFSPPQLAAALEELLGTTI